MEIKDVDASYENVEVVFIPGRTPELILFDENNKEIERMLVDEYDYNGLHKLMAEKGFRKKKDATENATTTTPTTSESQPGSDLKLPTDTASIATDVPVTKPVAVPDTATRAAAITGTGAAGVGVGADGAGVGVGTDVFGTGTGVGAGEFPGGEGAFVPRRRRRRRRRRRVPGEGDMGDGIDGMRRRRRKRFVPISGDDRI